MYNNNKQGNKQNSRGNVMTYVIETKLKNIKTYNETFSKQNLTHICHTKSKKKVRYILNQKTIQIQAHGDY